MNTKKMPISSILELLYSTMFPTISQMREFSPSLHFLRLKRR